VINRRRFLAGLALPLPADVSALGDDALGNRILPRPYVLDERPAEQPLVDHPGDRQVPEVGDEVLRRDEAAAIAAPHIGINPAFIRKAREIHARIEAHG